MTGTGPVQTSMELHMKYSYKNASDLFSLPHDIAARIESCERALYLAGCDGLEPAMIRKLEQELDYWQDVQFHYW